MLRPSLPLFALAAACVLAAPAVSARRLDNIDFHIKQGKHGASNDGIGAHMIKVGKNHSRRVSFKVLFPSNASYTLPIASNQSDANKVMGISIGRIHEDSVRLGWAWDPAAQKMQLRFYSYFNGHRDMTPLLQVPLNQWVDCEIKMDKAGMSVRAGSAYVEKKVALGWNGGTITAILRTAYFGGDSTAPHDIHVQVKDIDAD